MPAAVNVNEAAELSAASPTIDCLIVKVLATALSVPVVIILDLIEVVPLAALFHNLNVAVASV